VENLDIPGDIPGGVEGVENLDIPGDIPGGEIMETQDNILGAHLDNLTPFLELRRIMRTWTSLELRFLESIIRAPWDSRTPILELRGWRIQTSLEVRLWRHRTMRTWTLLELGNMNNEKDKTRERVSGLGSHKRTCPVCEFPWTAMEKTIVRHSSVLQLSGHRMIQVIGLLHSRPRFRGKESTDFRHRVGADHINIVDRANPFKERVHCVINYNG
jgi:hypothetical protein